MTTPWEKRKLSELMSIQNGYAFDSEAFSPSEGVPLIRIRDLREGTHTETYFSGDFEKKYLVRSGDLLVGMDGEFGCYEWKGALALLNQRVCRLESFSPELLPRFLFYGLNNHLKAIEDVTGYATVKHVSSRQILDIDFPAPSVSEQRRIVSILDKAFAAIAITKSNTEKNLQNARALFDSYLQSVLSRRGDHWVETRLGAEVILLPGYAFKSAYYTSSDKSVRLLRGDNIVQGALRWDDVKKWPTSKLAEYAEYQLREGDVVLAMDRPWVKAGLKHAMITKDDLPCLLVQRVARFRMEKDLDSRFLMYLIGTTTFTHHILGAQTGLGVPHISGQQIKDFKFLRPSLTEQRAIADQLDELKTNTQQLESIYVHKLSALDELKKSLLHQAFHGQL